MAFDTIGFLEGAVWDNAPAGEEVVAVADFRNAMRRAPGAVSVVTTRCEGIRYGLTATAICSLSAEPPQILVCVNRTSSFLRPLMRSRRFVVNFLSSDQEDVAQAFAARVSHPELKFRTGAWRTGAFGQAVLESSAASLVCKLSETLTRASHLILIGRVLETVPSNRDPLVYFDGGYRVLGPRLPDNG
jgi:flavin reductase